MRNPMMLAMLAGLLWTGQGAVAAGKAAPTEAAERVTLDCSWPAARGQGVGWSAGRMTLVVCPDCAITLNGVESKWSVTETAYQIAFPSPSARHSIAVDRYSGRIRLEKSMDGGAVFAATEGSCDKVQKKF